MAVVSARGASSESLPSRRKALGSFLPSTGSTPFRRSPEFASIRGDRRWNDKVSDLSPRAIEADESRTRRFVARLEAIDPTGFPEQEALTQTLLRRRLEENLENVRFAAWKMPVNPVSGIHLQALEIVSLLPFQTVKDYDDYISRLRQLPRQFEDTSRPMRKGMSEHLMPPKYLLERVADQAEGVANHAPEKTEFAEPLTRIEPAISPPPSRRGFASRCSRSSATRCCRRIGASPNSFGRTTRRAGERNPDSGRCRTGRRAMRPPSSA